MLYACRCCNLWGEMNNGRKALLVSLTLITTMVAVYFVLPDHLLFVLMIFSPFAIGGLIFGLLLFGGGFFITKTCDWLKRK